MGCQDDCLGFFLICFLAVRFKHAEDLWDLNGLPVYPAPEADVASMKIPWIAHQQEAREVSREVQLLSPIVPRSGAGIPEENDGRKTGVRKTDPFLCTAQGDDRDRSARLVAGKLVQLRAAIHAHHCSGPDAWLWDGACAYEVWPKRVEAHRLDRTVVAI